MEDVFLCSLARVRHSMSPIRETFPSPVKPVVFRNSYHYLVPQPTFKKQLVDYEYSPQNVAQGPSAKGSVSVKPFSSPAREKNTEMLPRTDQYCVESYKDVMKNLQAEIDKNEAQSQYLNEVHSLREKLDSLALR